MFRMWFEAITGCMVPIAHYFPIKPDQGVGHGDYSRRPHATAGVSRGYIDGRNILPATCTHVHDAIPVHCEPAELPTFGTCGTRPFAVGVKTIGRIDTLRLDAGELLQQFNLELRRSKPLTYMFCKNCVTHLVDVHLG